MAFRFNSDRLSSDDNNVFYFDKGAGDEMLAPDELSQLLSKHNRAMHNWFNKLMKYYLGKHSILEKMSKAPGKPDNRLIVNFAKELVDTEVGYFAGTPVKFDYDDNGKPNDELDQAINKFVDINDLTDIVAELAKQVDIFGRSYVLVYQNEEKETRVAPVDPRNGFIVYDSSIERRPVFGIYYTQKQRNGELSGTLYTKTATYSFTGTPGAEMTIAEEVVDNQFMNVPMVEFYASTERQGLFEQVISLIDAVEVALSNKGNDIDYFSNTIMKVINAKLKPEIIKDMIDKRVINVASVDTERDVTIDFMNKPDADGIQENFLDRVIDMIYNKSNVANFNDDVFGNASGTSLEFKLQSMSTAANMKERKFKMSLRQMWRLAFTIGATLPLDTGDKDYANNVKMTFKRTVPHNVQDEANTAKVMLDAGVDRKTALSEISTIEDPDAVIKAKEQEQKDAAKSMMGSLSDETDADFDKQEAK